MVEKKKKQQDNSENTDLGEMTLTEHLAELRKRLINSFIAIFIGFAISYHFSEDIFWVLMEPLLKVLPPKDGKMVFLTLTEPFITYLKVAFVTGLFLASPVIFWEIWKFIAPGLYPHERKYVIPFVISASISFIGGAFFGYFIVFPFAFKFLISFANQDITASLSMAKYFSFTTKMLIAFGLIFELPLITLFLSRLGIVTADMLKQWRKYAIVIIFIVSAILTPPDVMSQLLMAVPLIILYEISVIIARIFGRKKKPA